MKNIYRGENVFISAPVAENLYKEFYHGKNLCCPYILIVGLTKPLVFLDI